jgi:hypothetical protein
MSASRYSSRYCGGIELAGHRLDELRGHLLLGRLDLRLLLGQVELAEGADLVRPVEG